MIKPSPPIPLSHTRKRVSGMRGKRTTGLPTSVPPPAKAVGGKAACEPGIFNARTVRVLGIVLGAIALAICCGCGNPVNHSAADRIAAVLPKVLGPAKSYDVKVSGSSLSFNSGHIDKLVIHGDEVAFSPQLTVDTLDAEVRQIDIDTRAQKVTSMGPVHFIAGISAAHLNQYLAATAAGAPSRPQNLAVQIADQSLAITFTVRPLGVNVPVSVTGMLTPQSARPTLLDFQPTGARVSIVPVPAGVVNLALSHVNPVVDLSTLSVPVSVERTWLQNGRLYLEGSAVIPASSFSHSS